MEKPKTNSREENLTLINTNIQHFASHLPESIYKQFVGANTMIMQITQRETE